MEHLSPSKTSAKVEATLDPLEWIHSDVHELLFQHFTPEVSLRASLVSQAWNKSTESSLKCWEKLELEINWRKTRRINRPIVDDFKSSRKYQKLLLKSLLLKRNDDVRLNVSGLISVIRGRKWSSVKMYRFDCESVHLKEILKVVEPTVEMLHIESSWFSSSNNTDESDGDRTMLKYPKLKDFKWNYCDGFPLKYFVGDCTTLEKLEVQVKPNDPALNDGSFNSVLENNAKLQKISYYVRLNLRRLEAKPIFPALSTLNHRFKLKHLILLANSAWHDPENRILSFLESQANNLEELKMDPCTAGLETLKTVLKMKMSKVSLRLFANDLIADWNNISFNRNFTIEDFNPGFLFESSDNVIELLGNVLQYMPNCQQLRVSRLNGAALRSIAQHCPRIKKLRVSYFEVQNIDELPDLSSIEFFRCGSPIKETLSAQIRAKPDEARTLLEKLILQPSEEDSDSHF